MNDHELNKALQVALGDLVVGLKKHATNFGTSILDLTLRTTHYPDDNTMEIVDANVKLLEQKDGTWIQEDRSIRIRLHDLNAEETIKDETFNY